MGAVGTARVIRGEGTSASDWREWLPAQSLATRSLDDLITVGRRLVVIAPHPDDELLACGGLLAQHAARGGAARVIAVTDGEASHPGHASTRHPQLADSRTAERTRGLARLGAPHTQLTRLGFPDGRTHEHQNDLLGALQRLLMPSDVVVSTWSLDGHPDHDAAGLCAFEASRRVRCRLLQAPVWMWHWAAPGDARVPWHRLVGLPLDADTGRRKLDGVAAHESQLEPRSDGLGPVLGTEILARAAWPVEYYFE